MEGSAKVLVTAVGTHSQTGIIMSLLGATDEKEEEQSQVKSEEASEPTATENTTSHKKHPMHPTQSHKKKEQSVLQAKLTRLAIQIGYGGMSIAILTVLVLVVRYCIKEYAIGGKSLSISIINPLIKFFITGITVLVVAVPEGLPLAVTISLAYAVKVICYIFRNY